MGFRIGININMTGGGGGAPFNPLSISGLKLWLDASQITGLVDGDPVGTWSDLSGNGLHLTQATAAKKPTYKVNIQNGKPAVRFDGVDDFLQSSTFPSLLTQPTTVFIVAKNTNTTATHLLMDGLTVSNRQVVDYASAVAEIFAGSAVTGVGAVSTTFKILTAVFNSASSKLRINGADYVTGNAGTNNLDGLSLGGRYDQTFPHVGDVCELLLYGSLASASSITSMETLLNTKWGVY